MRWFTKKRWLIFGQYFPLDTHGPRGELEHIHKGNQVNIVNRICSLSSNQFSGLHSLNAHRAFSHTHVLVDKFFSYPVAPGLDKRKKHIAREVSMNKKKMKQHNCLYSVHTDVLFQHERQWQISHFSHFTHSKIRLAEYNHEQSLQICSEHVWELPIQTWCSNGAN